MGVRTGMIEKLTAAFSPERLDVIDDSSRHAGHLGNPGSPGASETHFTIKMVSGAFRGKSRIQRHRMIHEVLAEDLSGGVHALALDLKTPEEGAGG